MPEMIDLTIRAGHHVRGHREGYGHGLDSGLEHGIPGTEIYQHDGPRAGRSTDYCAGYDQGYVAGLKDGMGEDAYAVLHAKMLAMVAARRTQ
jgi:hypothetical protein